VAATHHITQTARRLLLHLLPPLLLPLLPLLLLLLLPLLLEWSTSSGTTMPLQCQIRSHFSDMDIYKHHCFAID
jgi:hypothetical protein